MMLEGEPMRAVMLLVAFGLAIAGPVRELRAGETQKEMNEQASVRFTEAEADLKQVLADLQAKAVGKTDALEVLRRAQAAWENYRDEQLRALWPFPGRTSYGSANPMCVAEIKAELTRARTRELRAMLKPAEGDSCGSQWPE
jgi:uncharacterized protein YecT (DUF1311 family)